MFHFLAKIGRKPGIEKLMPLLGPFVGTGYLLFQWHGHSKIRDIFAVHTPKGRIGISQELQELITGVYTEISDQFAQQIIELKSIDLPKPQLKWFCSATLEPITVGSTDFRSGVLIGVPNHYNYKRVEELPQSMFEIHTMRLFNISGSNSLQGSENKVTSDIDLGEQKNVILIDRNSPDGRSFADSLIFSEKAKKFSIARELFYGDSMRTAAVFGVICLSLLMGTFMSRGAVKLLKIRDAHVSQRMGIYVVGTTIAYAHFRLMTDAINRYYTLKADDRASNVNEAYREGAVEYFSKLMQRNRALRNLIEEMATRFDEEGNARNFGIRLQHVPLSERLAAINKATTT